MTSESIARWRVPVGWLLGLLALWMAEPTGIYLVAGIVVALMGEALRLWASGYLEKDRRLATEGPYAWTRNPLYLGSLIVGLGFTLATGRLLFLLLLVALFVAVYLPVMKREASASRSGVSRRLPALRVAGPAPVSAIPSGVRAGTWLFLEPGLEQPGTENGRGGGVGRGDSLGEVEASLIQSAGAKAAGMTFCRLLISSS